MHQIFSKRYSLWNWYISTRSEESWISLNFIPMCASYVDSGTREKFHPSWRNPQLGKIQSYILHWVESYSMYTLFLNGRSLILRLKWNLMLPFFITFSCPDLTLVVQGKCSSTPANGLGQWLILYSMTHTSPDGSYFTQWLMLTSLMTFW